MFSEYKIDQNRMFQFFYKNSQVEKGKIDAIKFIIEEKREVFKSIFVYKYNDATDINDIESNGI